MYEVFPESIQPHNMKNRDIYWRRCKIQETLYIGQWCLSPLQSRHLGTSHSSSNHHQLPCCTFLKLIDSLKSLPFQKVILVLRKARSCRAPNLCYRGAESPGWFEVWLKNSAWAGTLLWWSCQSPVAHSCGLLIHPHSFYRGMFKPNTKLDVGSLLYTLSHFEGDGHTVHMLTQWHLLPPPTSAVKSSLFMHVHSSPLSLAARLHWCYTNLSHYVANGYTFSGQTLYPLMWGLWVKRQIHFNFLRYLYTAFHSGYSNLHSH